MILSVPFTNQTTPKRWPWKLAYRPIKNHLIVISISFLAFNFRGIIRRTSGKHSPLLFSFLIYAKIREALVECRGKKSEVWREREKDFELDWQRELFHFISLKDRSRVSSVVAFPPPPLIFISSLYLCSRSFFHLSFTQTFHFCKIMDFTSVLRKIYGCFEIKKRLFSIIYMEYKSSV